MYRLLILLLLIIFSFFSCSQQQKQEKQLKEISFSPPVTIIASPPVLTLLKDFTPPHILVIPSQGTRDYTIPTLDGPQIVSLSAPKIYPLISGEAGGYTYMQNYNTEHGLALSTVSCGYSDKLGNLWFGTYGGGVSRYDGKSFTNYTAAQGLAGNLIKTITEDRSGNLWFGTNGSGVSKYDGRSFTTYTTEHGLADNIVKSITEDKKGNLWFCTDNGVSRYNPDLKSRTIGKTFINFTTAHGLLSNTVSSSFEDKQGNIWFGTSAGVNKYDPSTLIEPGSKSFTTFTITQGLVNNDVRSIGEDNSGNIWFGTRGGVSKYDPNIRESVDGKFFTNYTATDGLANNNVQNIKKDKDGNVWLATGVGLSKYDPVKKTFINFTTEQGLANNVVYNITEDKFGSLWFGTNGGGLNKYNGKSLTSFSAAQGLVSDRVWSILEDKTGNIWFSTSAGVSKYEGATFYNISIPYITSNARSIIQDKVGNFWLGNAIGVSKLDQKSFTTYTKAQGFVNKGMLSMIEDRMGNLWFGTYGNGVTKFDGRSFTNYTTAQGLAGNIVKCITEDRSGNLWFGTNGNGLSKYDPSAKLRTGSESFTNYTTAQGLADNTVLSSIEDKFGNIWLGTDGGVSKFDPSAKLSAGVSSFTNYTTVQGLANDVVYAIAEDTVNNMVWFGTNLGLSGLKLNSLSSGAKFENFNSKTGYPIKDINTSALLVDSKGIIWAGTSDKLVRFDYKAILKSIEPPQVFVQALKINGEKISWYNLRSYGPAKTIANKQDDKNDSLAILNEEAINFGQFLTDVQREAMYSKFSDIKFDSITPFYPLPLNLELPFKHNNVTFDFVGIETSRSQLVRYKYFLEGYDSDWNPATDKTFATFGNIYEGSYTFKLKAQSPDGIWSEPVMYTFTVLPPWYRTWWMYSSYLFIVLSSIGLFFRWRTASLIKEKEILELTVKERTAEVVEQKELVEKKNEFIEEKQKEIVDSINYAKRIQYTLLANDVLLQQNLKEYFVLFQPKDIVSGDFYWATLNKGTGDRGQGTGELHSSNTGPSSLDSDRPSSRFYLAICDSTGHGVPGAFMSLLNSSFLNEAITEKNIKQPNEILNYVRQRLIESISQDGAQDGMDGILLCFENDKITYAAANNAPVIVRDNSVIDLPADKMPIGKGEKDNSFTLHTIDTQKGDLLYFYTDGYADQFGGPKGKKFKYKQLENLLVSIHRLPLEEQNQMLAIAIENWKGDLEQVDDILIIGMRV